MNKTICLLPGDGIGPEILAQGAAVLAATAQKFGHTFDSEEALIGGAAVDATGSPLPEATVEACRKADAVYLGAVGGPFAYLVGARLGGVWLPLGVWTSGALLALIWALLLPLLMVLIRRCLSLFDPKEVTR